MKTGGLGKKLVCHRAKNCNQGWKTTFPHLKTNNQGLKTAFQLLTTTSYPGNCKFISVLREQEIPICVQARGRSQRGRRVDGSTR